MTRRPPRKHSEGVILCILFAYYTINARGKSQESKSASTRTSAEELARVSGNSGEAGTADDAPQVVTVREASRITGLSVRTLYDAIDSGALPAFMPAGAQRGIRIRRADLARAICAGVGR